MRKIVAALASALASAWAFSSQAAVSFVGVDPAEVTVASASWTADIPAGTQNDDFLIFIFCTTSAANGVSYPSGVSELAEIAIAGVDSEMVVAGKIAASEGSTLAFTSVFDNTETGAVVTLAYRGTDVSGGTVASVIVASAGADAGTVTAISGPSIDTTGTDGAMFVQTACADPAAAAYSGSPDSSPTGTERYDAKDSADNSYIYVQDHLQTTGAALALDITALTSDSYSAYQVALKPAAGSSSGLLLRRRRN